MDTSEKLLVMGITALVCVVILSLGVSLKKFPNPQNYKRLWIVLIIPLFIVGIVFLILSFRM